MHPCDDRTAISFTRAFEVVRNGFISPYHLNDDDPRVLSGCVYRDDGTKVDLSERVGGIRGDFISTRNPGRLDRPGVARHLSGRGAYLGQFMSWHFGHFMFETLSTFWIFEEIAAGNFDYFVFHPFAFGTEMAELNRFCLARFGIDPSRVVLAESEPLTFDELYVPARLARLNDSSDPSLRWAYERIVEDSPGRTTPPRRLYISRRVFNAKHSSRVVVNEMQVEALFAQAGFEVLYPEVLPFAEQVERCAGGTAIAGFSGSNLFNVLFARPDALLVEIGDPRYSGAPNPCVPACAGVAGARHRFIPFHGRQFGPRMTMHIDIDYLAEQLGAMVQAELPPQETPCIIRRPALKPGDMLELGYRSVRPTLGYLAHQLVDTVRSGVARGEPPRPH